MTINQPTRSVLVLHPDSVCEAVSSIVVDMVRTADGVFGLRFVASGRIGDLALPEPTASTRGDRLWERTCFEAFLGDEEGEGYTELNISPSTQWAGYRFKGYRSGMSEAFLPPPRIEVETGTERLMVRAALRLRPGGASRRLGLSAVIEEANGNRSFWALAHPPGAPDFHHRDCFAAELPPAIEP